jgi:hypothetical protein
MPYTDAVGVHKSLSATPSDRKGPSEVPCSSVLLAVVHRDVSACMPQEPLTRIGHRDPDNCIALSAGARYPRLKVYTPAPREQIEHFTADAVSQ